MVWQNRNQAGQQLAQKLSFYQKTKNLVVLAIPRGGLVIGQPVAKALGCPLEILAIKKIGAPNNPELALGAIGASSQPIINEELVLRLGVTDDFLQKQITKIKKEVKRREKIFRGNKPPLNLGGKVIILVDDGAATGATVLAAIEVVRQQNPKKIVVALPVVAKDTLAKIEKLADEVVFLAAPALFFAVGQFYQEFNQVSDQEVISLLK